MYGTEERFSPAWTLLLLCVAVLCGVFLVREFRAWWSAPGETIPVAPGGIAAAPEPGGIDPGAVPDRAAPPGKARPRAPAPSRPRAEAAREPRPARRPARASGARASAWSAKARRWSGGEPVPRGYGRQARALVTQVRKNEKRYAALGWKYTKRYEVFRWYGREWMRRPELRQLTREWFIHHDPVRFAKGALAADGFYELFGRFLARPETQRFIAEAIAMAPDELYDAIMDYLRVDPETRTAYRRLAPAAKLPPNPERGRRVPG